MGKYKQLKTLNILYVEDDKDVRDEVEEMLSLKVKKLFVAVDGEDGYNQYKQRNPDIVITDIQMPKLTGIQMIEKIRQINSEIPIIITTAFNDTSFMKDAIDLHVDKYITKPVDISQLFSTLNRAALIIYQKAELKQKDTMLKNREKITALNELLVNVSHHWRQPLSAITTQLSGIKVEKEFDTLTDEKFDSTIDDVINKIEKFSKTIDSFSNFYRNSDLKENYCLDKIILDYITLTQDSFDSEDIVISSNLDKIEKNIIKDDFIQILSILINNAKDILKTIDNYNGYMKIELVKSNEKTVLKIIDNGGGIDEKILEKIFEPYFTTKHTYSGTGLGLYMVEQIVRNSLEGTIEVKNIDVEYQDKIYAGVEFKIIF